MNRELKNKRVFWAYLISALLGIAVLTEHASIAASSDTGK
jgi:hypothetical protein